VRIGVALVDTTFGTQTWSARYDRPFKDVFTVQDEIVRKVVTTLGLIVKANQLDVPHWSAAPNIWSSETTMPRGQRRGSSKT
jgi:hypothetical protein